MTYIYEKIDEAGFIGAFERMGRGGDFGGYRCVKALFEYLEALAEDKNEPVKLNVVELCCEFSHWDSIEEYNEDCGTEFVEPWEMGDKLVVEVGDGSFITHAH